ncbi:MAG: KEOPS complex N(6)-L-threonylcarbamoyladenine synthase Kae1 [Conexivisphaerales archaeon]
MTIGLGIESTAHTFSASVIDDNGKIYSNVKSVYKPPSGSGIHPREASRHHAEVASSVVLSALKEPNINYRELDFISYSAGPGLGPCLRVGATISRFIAAYYGKPLIPVHHGVGHIELGSLLTDAKDPLALLLSGGHTMVLAAVNKRWGVFGETLDLTLGQLIDQFGRAIGLASPAGPAVEKIAEKGSKYVDMPYAVKGNDLSFSGLLTSAKKKLSVETQENLAFSLQETAFAMLSEVSERALALLHKKELLVVGGVAANARLKQMLELVSRRHECKLKIVPPEYAGDCGAQIAWTGLLYFKSGYTVKPDSAFVSQSWRIDEVNVPWRS